MDHHQRWSRIFRSEETETDLSIWIPTEISRIFGIMESTPSLLASRFSASKALQNVRRNTGNYRKTDLKQWLNYRIQGHPFPCHWRAKAAIVICLIQEKILTNLHVLTWYGPKFYSYSKESIGYVEYVNDLLKAEKQFLTLTFGHPLLINLLHPHRSCCKHVY